MGYSGAGGKLIDEKNQKQKISWHCPFKGIKLKEKAKGKKNQESGSGPLLAGYGLGTRIWATLARILIPGPDTDPRLQIRVRVLAWKHRHFGLFADFFYGLF